MVTSWSSDNPNRPNPTGRTDLRSSSVIKVLQMYRHRPKEGKLDRKAAKAPARINPSAMWFGNIRVTDQKQLGRYRAQFMATMSDPYKVALKSRKIPTSLITRDGNNANEARETRAKGLTTIQPFLSTFGKKVRRKNIIHHHGDSLAEYVTNARERQIEAERIEQEKATEIREKAARELALITDMDSVLEESKVDEDGLEDESQVSCETQFLANAIKLPDIPEGVMGRGTSKRIWAELYKVIDSSDVIVHVLDCRDVPGTRCLELEKELASKAPHKKIIFVLNKADLVPVDVARHWLHILSKDHPTVLFRAAGTKPVGKATMLQVLCQFIHLHSNHRHVCVGFLGYPNVGKSSVINVLKAGKACKTAPIPGETKVWQYVALTRKTYLIDCPGIVPIKGTGAEADTARVLRGAIRPERVIDPETYVPAILSRVKRSVMNKVYKLPQDADWKNAIEFLQHAGRRYGRLIAGGEVDIGGMAVDVIKDWQRGKIPYCVYPPDFVKLDKSTNPDSFWNEQFESVTENSGNGI